MLHPDLPTPAAHDRAIRISLRAAEAQLPGRMEDAINRNLRRHHWLEPGQYLVGMVDEDGTDQSVMVQRCRTRVCRATVVFEEGQLTLLDDDEEEQQQQEQQRQQTLGDDDDDDDEDTVLLSGSGSVRVSYGDDGAATLG